MQRDSWPLLALSYADECRLSPVQVQKALFLVGENIVDEDTLFYHFEPYHYGPFDSGVYADLDALVESGLVRKVEASAFRGFEYELTPAGVQRADQIRKALGKRERTYLAEVVPWVRRLTFRQLVTAIYNAFPKMAENSVFKY